MTLKNKFLVRFLRLQYKTTSKIRSIFLHEIECKDFILTIFSAESIDSDVRRFMTEKIY